MIDGLRPYSEMKASRLTWLGDVPSHWDVRRSKYGFREVDNRSVTGQETHLSMSQRLGLVPASQVEKSLISESYVGAKLVQKDDLVLNRLKAHLGVFAYAKQPGLISPDYTVLRPKSRANVRYFEYVLKSPACRGELRIRAKGIVEGFWRLYTDDFYDIRLPMPPLNEQRLIVRFLDWHGVQTARLIRAKKTLIALLNEQKQAIISRAVTRGLNPNAKLKSSGISWLGDVPSDWEVKRLKWVTRLQRGYDLPADKRIAGSHPVVSSGGVIDHHAEYKVHAPGVVMGRYGSTEAVFYIEEDFWPHNTSLFVTDFQGNLPLWCCYLLQTISKADHSSKSAVPGVDRKDLFDIVVAVPAYGEQIEVVRGVEDRSKELNNAISAVEREVALILEFRLRLIADLVTGKLDVRSAAASLPEAIDLEPAGLLPDDEATESDLDQPETEELAA